eukprot:CAMPEP_0195532682 /NCGR_PEP_ID=MMETSP0794_2-20130614/38864_1 /TAXON_ID=515487 /ORGANISM="Stephanopyxis turris, Strain CCMP 815" /LENGTH=161 /DNA_ID=CAMNT_0040665009 /DNA_START=387 /DNA_END=872 /DNA_ORIENTATION=+
MEEIRASLGPVGRTIAGGVEVGIVTGGSFLSGCVLGYTIGGVFGIPSMFKSDGGNFGQRVKSWNGKAATQAKSWATLSAAFSGFHALSRVMRGGKEDKWNGIAGSFATGAFLNRKAGPQAMLQGSVTYASVTYLFDLLMGSGGGGAPQEEEFGFTDAAVEE